MSAKSRNPDVRMQAVTSNDKARTEGVEDPDYENMTFAFKHQDKFKSREKLPRNPGPAQRGHPSGPASAPHCLNKAILSLYILLAVTFIFLSVFILIENSRMTNKLGVLNTNITMLSMNLMELKIELENISKSVKAVQKNQMEDHDKITKKIEESQKAIQANLKEHKILLDKLPTLQQATNSITKKVDEILKNLPKPNASTSSRK